VGILRLALPAGLALWFIWKARSNLIFLLGIPVLMVMGGSVFFENMKPFRVPGRFSLDTLLMGWLAVVWIVTVVRRSRVEGRPLGLFGVGRVLPEELPLIGIALLIGAHVLKAFAAIGDLNQAVSLASGACYLALGYVFLRGILCRATRAETQEFLAAVVVVNTLACAMFILDQGLHLPIYLGDPNITSFFAGQDITRATTFAPVFTLLSIGFVLGKRRWTPPWLVVLGITLVSVLVSLTRTLLIAAVVGLAIAVVARELARPDFSRVARRTGTVVLGAAVVAAGFSRMAPAYWSFLLKRFSEFTSGKSGVGVANWHLRVIHWDAVQRVVAKSDLLFGIGFPRPGSNPVDLRIFLWSSDMTWLPIMYMFGYVGLLLFALLLAGFMARALRLSLRPPELRRELALTYFITIALTVIMGFQMWTFMEPSVYPMGLLVLALVAAEALRPAGEPDALPAAAGQPTSAAGDHRELARTS
jgi:hypothetical protein